MDLYGNMRSRDLHRRCGIVTACWGWGRSPHWWNYPNSWPPHTCRAWGQTLGETWWDLWWSPVLRVWHAWHYTEGWGSLGTIAVADDLLGPDLRGQLAPPRLLLCLVAGGCAPRSRESHVGPLETKRLLAA